MQDRLGVIDTIVRDVDGVAVVEGLKVRYFYSRRAELGVSMLRFTSMYGYIEVLSIIIAYRDHGIGTCMQHVGLQWDLIVSFHPALSR